MKLIIKTEILFAAKKQHLKCYLFLFLFALALGSFHDGFESLVLALLINNQASHKIFLI